MKKRIALGLVFILIFALCSCSKSHGTKLSADNFTKYFNIETGGTVSGDLKWGNKSKIGGAGTYTCSGYDKFSIWCYINPISEHFIYSDVVVQIFLSGYYIGCDDVNASNEAGYTVHAYEPISFTTTLNISIDLSGKGTGSEIISVPDGKWIDKFGEDTILTLNDYEILSVEGRVEKA